MRRTFHSFVIRLLHSTEAISKPELIFLIINATPFMSPHVRLKINFVDWMKCEKTAPREDWAIWIFFRFPFCSTLFAQTVGSKSSIEQVAKMVFLYLILGLLLLLYVYMTWNFDYWSKRGVPSMKATVLLGNMPSTIFRNRHVTYDFDKIYA